MFGLPTFAASMTCWAIFGGSLLAAHIILYLMASRSRPLMRQIGGVAIFIPFVVVCLLCLFRATPFMISVRASDTQMATLLFACGAMTVLGVLADSRRIPFSIQLLVQTVIAYAVCAPGIVIYAVDLPTVGLIHLGSGASVLLTIIWLLAFTNSLRFLKGLGRFSAAVASGCLLTLALIASLNNSTLVVLLTLSLAGGTLGLILFNLNPNPVQLGWSGKYLLGFSIGLITLIGAHKTTGLLVYWIPLLLLGFQLPRLSILSRPQFSAVSESTLHSVLLRLVVAGFVASVGYAIFEAGNAQKSWWFTGKSKYILLAVIFGITYLAMNLRPVRKAWHRHRRNLVLSALARYFRERMEQHGDFQTINSLLAIAQAELGLHGLEVACLDGAGRSEVLGFRPQFGQPLPVLEIGMDTVNGVHLTILASFEDEPDPETCEFCRRWLERILADWTVQLPLPASRAEDAESWPVDAEGCIIFPTPDILYEWNGMKAKISL